MRSELRKQQETETVKLFDCNHFAHVIVLWQMQKFMCYYTVFAFSFCIWGQFRSTGSRGLIFGGGNLTEDFFFLRYEFGGLKFGGAYFWIFRYFESFCSKVSGLKSKLGKVPLSVYTSVIKLSELEYTSRHTLTYCMYRRSSSSWAIILPNCQDF